MAIIKSVIKNGVSIPNAYIKIANMRGDKNRVFYNLDFSASVSHDPIYSVTHDFTPDLDGDNFIKQAYAHLKSLPEYSGAVDC